MLPFLKPQDGWLPYQYGAYYLGVLLAASRIFGGWWMVEAIMHPHDPHDPWTFLLFLVDGPIGIIFLILFLMNKVSEFSGLAVVVLGTFVGMYWHLVWPQGLARLFQQGLGAIVVGLIVIFTIPFVSWSVLDFDVSDVFGSIAIGAQCAAFFTIFRWSRR